MSLWPTLFPLNRTMPDPIVQCSDLRRTFRMGETDIHVLRGVNFAVSPGEFVAIEGRSGSGKSTLLHILGGLDGCDGGRVRFEETDYTTLTFAARKRLWPRLLQAAHSAVTRFPELLGTAVGRVAVIVLAIVLTYLAVIGVRKFEGDPFAAVLDGWWPGGLVMLLMYGIIWAVLIGLLRVGSWIAGGVVALVGKAFEHLRHGTIINSARHSSGFRNQRFGFVFQFYHLLPELNVLENTLAAPMIGRWSIRYLLERRQTRARAHELLSQLGMGHRLHHRPSQLSGGERQRVAIARALMNDPQVLFADEPTGNLDSETGGQIMKLLESLHAKGQTIVMVTHDRTIARRADRTFVMKDGLLERA